jgi:hypothetical protein
MKLPSLPKPKLPAVPETLFTYGAVITYSYMFGSTIFLAVMVLKETGYDLSAAMEKLCVFLGTLFYFIGSFAGVLSRNYPSEAAVIGTEARYKSLARSPSPSPTKKRQ